jgi:CRP-like cAMP-binding protein
MLASRVALFAGLARGDLSAVFGLMRRVDFAPGAMLVRQGEPADSALIVELGRATAMAALPGGGETPIAEFGPGSVLGETALLDGGVRVASVVASEPTACLAMERDAFRLLVAQGNRAVREIHQRITRALCQRLRDLNGKILAISPPEELAYATPNFDAPRAPCGFEVRGFLHLLPAFQGWTREELDVLLTQVALFELPRGARLFRAGEAGGACYVVLRGALEITREEGASERRIGILGPGRLCGVLGLIEDQPHSMSASAREQVALMEISQVVFEAYFRGDGVGAAKFQHAIHQELLRSLARTNNHLTRLISQARIHHHVERVTDLQRELAAQEGRAAG